MKYKMNKIININFTAKCIFLLNKFNSISMKIRVMDVTGYMYVASFNCFASIFNILNFGDGELSFWADWAVRVAGNSDESKLSASLKASVGLL